MNIKPRELTKAELEVMQILWDKGAAFVNEIIEVMPAPKPAYNTVSTVVRVLEKKGAVSHKSYGKSHQYYPLFSKEEYTQSLMKGIMNNFFDNSLARMVSFFYEKENLSLKETEEIISIAQKAIKEHKQ